MLANASKNVERNTKISRSREKRWQASKFFRGFLEESEKENGSQRLIGDE